MEHFEKYLGLTFRYLGVRNRSEKEIRDYLLKKKASDEIIERIVARLYELKFLNDETFARGWVLNRSRTKPRGEKLLKLELQQKGIQKDLIEKVLEDAQAEMPDELTQAKQLITKRVEKLKTEPKQVLYQKIGGFLARRGYSWEIIKKAIDEVYSSS